MKQSWILYKIDTGESIANLVGKKPTTAEIPKGVNYIEGTINQKTEYVDITKIPHTVALKTLIKYKINKTVLLADGLDKVVINTLPPGTTVYLQGNKYEVEDGIFELLVDLTGKYKLDLKNPIYLDTTITINAF